MSLHIDRPVVIAIRAAAVPVAAEVARELNAPLDLIAVREIGAPRNPRYGIGAVTENGVGVIDSGAVAALEVTGEELREITSREFEALRHEAARYPGHATHRELGGRTVILVDEGVTTGLAEQAALRAVRQWHPGLVVLALPVCRASAVRQLRIEADEVVCLNAPLVGRAVAEWYAEFGAVSESEIEQALERAQARHGNQGD